MPALTNPRYEAVARGLAAGRTATDAYASAGYRRNRSHASRLVANGNIRARVAELKLEVTIEVISAAAIDTLQEVNRLGELIKLAALSGDFRSAIDGQKFLLTLFGYTDNPTMSHEHFTSKGIARRAAYENTPRFSKTSEAIKEILKERNERANHNS